jgi:hypothetical protein
MIIDPRRIYWGSKLARTGLSSTQPTKRKPAEHAPLPFSVRAIVEKHGADYTHDAFDKSWSIIAKKSKFFYEVQGVPLRFSIRGHVRLSTWMNAASHREDIPNNYNLIFSFNLFVYREKPKFVRENGKWR